jgi:hypothetical protein
LSEGEDFGSEKDGSKSEKYCKFCYKHGEFTGPDMTMEEMIEVSEKGWAD